ncbi:MAG: hypothetical protein Tsb0010_00370 [Parvularculaceae bacterium]
MDAKQDLKRRARLFAAILGGAVLIGLTAFLLNTGKPRRQAEPVEAAQGVSDAAPSSPIEPAPESRRPASEAEGAADASGAVGSEAAAGGGAAALRAVEQNGRIYYLLEYALKPDAVLVGEDLAAMGGRRARMAEVTEGGQFEILIPVSEFPVPAPNCEGYIIVRMPWTDPDLANAERAIADKRSLYERIRAMRAIGEGVVTVTLELNPYVEVVSEEPLRLRLTQCNVFFRQQAGAYAPEAIAANEGQ